MHTTNLLHETTRTFMKEKNNYVYLPTIRKALITYSNQQAVSFWRIGIWQDYNQEYLPTCQTESREFSLMERTAAGRRTSTGSRSLSADQISLPVFSPTFGVTWPLTRCAMKYRKRNE